MTVVSLSRQRRPLVTTHDWGARAYCPNCGSCVSDIRFNHERDGMFYVVDFVDDSPRPLGLVYTVSLARLVAITAASKASGVSCPACNRAALAAAIDAVRNPVVHRVPAGTMARLQ